MFLVVFLRVPQTLFCNLMPIFLSFLWVHAQRCTIYSRETMFTQVKTLCQATVLMEQRAPGTMLEATCQPSRNGLNSSGTRTQYKGLLWPGGEVRPYA